MRPMLAATATGIPAGPEWVHEVKWDGMRILAEVVGGRLRLWSRTEREVTVAFPELAALADLGHDVLLDGEVVVMVDSVPSFEALAERLHVQDRRKAATLAARRPASYLVFDLLRLDGTDLMGRPFAQRRASLEALGLAGPHWQVPPTFTDGATLLAATAEQGLEGVVSKRLDAPYRPGRRSDAWLKTPHRGTLSVVVGGWRVEEGRTGTLGAVLVGVPGPDGLVYRGRVGSGLSGRAGAALLADLRPLTTAASPFASEVPGVDAAGTTWVRPGLVVDVNSLGVNTSGRLRQPSYRGRRLDLTPADLADGPDEGTAGRGDLTGIPKGGDHG